jgi:hypothetical protein
MDGSKMPEELKIPVIDPPEAFQTPQQVEQDVLKDQTPKSPMENLSAMVELYKTPFINLVNGKLSNNSLRRLIKALVLMPLEDMPLNFKRKEEKMAWQIGEELMKAKLTLIHYTMLEQQMKQEQDRLELTKEPAVKLDETMVESSKTVETEIVKET